MLEKYNERRDEQTSDAKRKGVGFMSGNLIITIGRQSGSGGKKIGEMLAENWELNAMIRSSLPRLQSTADFVKNYLKNMTSAQPAVFFILW